MNLIVFLSLALRNSWAEQRLNSSVDDAVRVIRLCWVRPVTQMYILDDGSGRAREGEKKMIVKIMLMEC